jgi:hypothetical protein
MERWLNVRSVLFIIAAVVFGLAGQDAGPDIPGFEKFFYAMGVFAVGMAAPKT